MPNKPRKHKPRKDNSRAKKRKRLGNPTVSTPATQAAAAVESPQAPVNKGSCSNENNSQAQKVEKMINWEWWFAAILVVCAIVQAIVGFWQWRTMSANTAQTQETLKLMWVGQRPWLAITEPKIRPLEDGKSIVGRFTIKNTGRTPAWIQDGIYDVTVDNMGTGLPMIMATLAISSKFRIPPSVVPPDGTVDITCDSGYIAGTYPPKWVGPSGKSDVSLNVFVRYRDSDGKLHWTTGCFTYDASTKSVATHSKYNDMNKTGNQPEPKYLEPPAM